MLLLLSLQLQELIHRFSMNYGLLLALINFCKICAAVFLEFGNQLSFGRSFLCKFDDDVCWDSLIKNRWTSVFKVLAVSGGFGVFRLLLNRSAMNGDEESSIHVFNFIC
ncbi:hypothetical protein AtEden1_Chr1g0054891 [Arabidopsis thaliana]